LRAQQRDWCALWVDERPHSADISACGSSSNAQRYG
jgi:hypothetical protein